MSSHADIPNPGPASSATLVAANCSPTWVSGNQMVFNQRGSNGLFNAYIGDINCQNAKTLLPATGGNVGASSVTPDGQYVALEEAYGPQKTFSDSQPGKGVNNEIVLLDRNTGRITTLTTGGLGTIWASLNSTATKITWSQMVKTPLNSGSIKNYALGIWQIHAADITPQGTLANEKVWSQPNDQGFYETYGFYGNQIMFASDAGVYPKSSLGNWLSSQDWLIDSTLPSGSTAVRVSQPLPNGFGGTSNDYHEFMSVAPSGTFSDSGPWFLTSIVYQANGGMDLWRMKPDGSGLQRLTYFNGLQSRLSWQQVQGYPAPQYTIVANLAIDPNNPKVIYANIIHSLSASQIDCWKIQIAP